MKTFFHNPTIRFAGFGSTAFIVFVGLVLVLGSGVWFLEKSLAPSVESPVNDIASQEERRAAQSELTNSTKTFDGILVDFKTLAAAPGIIYAGTETQLPDPASLRRDEGGNWVPYKSVPKEFSMQITKDTPIEGVSSFLALRTGMHIRVDTPASVYMIDGDFAPLQITVVKN